MPRSDPLLMVFAQNLDDGTRVSGAVARPKILDQSPQHPRAGVSRFDMLIGVMADAATAAHKGPGDVNLQREIAAL